MIQWFEYFFLPFTRIKKFKTWPTIALCLHTGENAHQRTMYLLICFTFKALILHATSCGGTQKPVGFHIDAGLDSHKDSMKNQSPDVLLFL